jgi:hypothetical protein|tara:strand:+ start:193 stop:597 length:405 start_codon:yes stop_codon:yes gene_type:complete
MADAVTSQTIFDGDKKVIQKFTNISDGTGESEVKKVDVSALTTNGHGQTCTSVTIEKIWWQCVGMKTRLFFDATSNAFIIELGENQSGYHDYSSFGGLKNNAGSGVTGDILFTTVGHSSADTYTITLEMRKNYD